MQDQFVTHLNTLSVDITEAFLLDQLQNRKRWPFRYSHTDQYGSIAVIDWEGRLLERQFVARMYSMDGYLDYRSFMDIYTAGYTIQLIDVLDIHPDLRTIDTTLRAYGQQFTANIYMSQQDRGAASFPPHSHPYDVIVKQLYGECTWLLGEDSVLLTGSSAVAVPAGTLHQVVSHRCPRASLTVNFG